jgi:coproporphyrinogen III oxidase
MQHPTSADIQRVREFLLDLQARICAGLEQQERAGGGTAEFIIDDWQRTKVVAVALVFCKMVK